MAVHSKNSQFSYELKQRHGTFPWRRTPSFGMEQKCFYVYFHLSWRILKKTWTQGSKFNTLNNRYCFIKDILKWTWQCFVNSKSAVITNTMTTCPGWWEGLEFYPPTLWHYWCQMVSTVKRANDISVLPYEEFLPPGMPPSRALGPPGAPGSHAEDHCHRGYEQYKSTL